MGAKIELTAFNQVLYINQAALEWYQRNNIDFKLLKSEIDDSVIEIFNNHRGTVAQEGSTYQELLNYYLYKGLLREGAVAKAQEQIGLPKETLIDRDEIFQTEIISDKIAKIEAAEKSIAEQTDTQKTTFEEIDLSQFGDSAPKINTETLTTEILRNLPRTDGDISSDALDFQVNIKGEEKTRDENKDTINKDGNNTTIIPTKKDSDPKDFKSFGLNTKYAIFGVLTAAIILGIVYYINKEDIKI